MKLLAALLLLGAVPAFAAPVDRPAKLPDGRTLNLWCDGGRGPVVLFDSGWAADSRAWRRVMAGLSDTHSLCSQDRAGSGLSDPGPLPRDGEAVAADLHAAARSLGLKGPYILVGHSLGALNMRHFARLFPDDVAGLVLVDPSLPGQGPPPPLVMRSRQCLEAAQAGPDQPDVPVSARCRTTPAEKAADRWEARLSELEAMPLTTSAGLAGQGAGSLAAPLIVLTAGRPSPDPAAAEAWQARHRELAGLSARGEARLVEESGHMMMFDQPEAIIQAVEDLARPKGRTARD